MEGFFFFFKFILKGEGGKFCLARGNQFLSIYDIPGSCGRRSPRAKT